MGKRVTRSTDLPPPSTLLADTRVHVLCVAADPDARERLESQLDCHLDRGTVSTVPSARDTLARIEDDASTVDCIVSEYALDGMDGLTLLSRVREEDAALPFILFTDQDSVDVASEAVSAGVTDYVQKGGPDAVERLATRVADAVEQARARRAREAAQAHFRALTENAPFAVVTVDETSTICYANDEVADLLGYTPDELVGEPLATLVPERLEDRHAAAFDRYLDTGERTLDWAWVELPGRHADGHEIPLGITFGEADHDGRQLFTGILRDITDQKGSRAQLERRAAAMEAAMDGMAILDDDDEYVYVNQAHADIYGYDSPDELVGETWHCLYDDDELRRFEGDIFPVIREEGHWRGEAVGTRTDGTTFPQEVSLTALDDGGLVCVVRDITERKARARAVETLHEATREMMRATDRQRVADVAVETAKEVLGMPVNGLWFHDPGDERLQPVAWTPEATEVVGDLPTFPAGASLSWEVFETGEARLFSDLLDYPERYNPATPIRSEIIVPVGDHGVINVGATEPDAFDESDVVLARLLAANTRAALDRIDRTDALRERTEQLERQNQYLSEFYVLMTDPETKFEAKLQDVLALCCDHFGFDVGLLVRFVGDTLEVVETHAPGLPVLPGDTLGLSADARELVPPPDAADEGVVHATAAGVEESAERPALQSRLGFEAYLQVPVYVGGERYGLLVLGSSTPSERSPDSTPVTLAKFVARWLDYELARHRARHELERQNERLDEFASVVSHDLRNPLNTAIGYVDLARTEDDAELLDAAERALDRMGALIADTLALARQGQTVEQSEPVALERTVDEAWATVAPDGDLQVEFDDVTVMADPDRLQQVFENLFRNADAHAGPDVTVRIGLLSRGRGFFVADDGPGIPEAEREAVFDHGHTTSSDGTGFGLSIVKSIVEAHGWDIDVTESTDGGARFEITGVELTR